MSVRLEPQSWPRRYWWWMVALVFGAQVGLVFCLGERSSNRPRVPSPEVAPSLELAGSAAENVLALGDPTLFALPQWRGFAGRAWMAASPPPNRSFDWKEEPRWLDLPVAQLGRLREAQPAELLRPPSLPAPPATLAEVEPLPDTSGHSSLRLAGGLAGRRLLTAFDLPSQPLTAHMEMPTNSVVQILVNAEGLLESLTLLSTSGLEAADKLALDLARTARFEPVVRYGPSNKPPSNSPPQLTWGVMLFEWHTVALPETNAAPSK